MDTTRHELLNVARVIVAREIRYRAACYCGWLSPDSMTSTGAHDRWAEHHDQKKAETPPPGPDGAVSLTDPPPTPRAPSFRTDTPSGEGASEAVRRARLLLTGTIPPAWGELRDALAALVLEPEERTRVEELRPADVARAFRLEPWQERFLHETPRRWGARGVLREEESRRLFDELVERVASALPEAPAAQRMADGLEATAVFVDEWAELRADPGLRAQWLAERPASERLRVAVDAADGLVRNAERSLRAGAVGESLGDVVEQLAAAVDELGAAQRIAAEISDAEKLERSSRGGEA